MILTEEILNAACLKVTREDGECWEYDPICPCGVIDVPSFQSPPEGLGSYFL